ncbi:hypothetical protein [Noviherbaspirillum humi]|uniref:hypothetical protein n=1 Tax=Noviherbaspirillum humi TaxID=1688639 RepID=UPI0011601253|nr:hypothetical protein [Noviherbaspirillum humi]
MAQVNAATSGNAPALRNLLPELTLLKAPLHRKTPAQQQPVKDIHRPAQTEQSTHKPEALSFPTFDRLKFNLPSSLLINIAIPLPSIGIATATGAAINSTIGSALKQASEK